MTQALMAATIVATLFGSSTSVLATGKILAGSELNEFFSNKVYTYYKKNGKKHATIYYHANGTVQSKLEDNGQIYSGKWYTKGDLYCTIYVLRPLKCFKVRTTDSPTRFDDLYFDRIDGYFVRSAWSGV
jgi:hypothetical protein